MKKTSATPSTTEQVSASVTGIVIGKIVRVNDSGQIQVDYPGNPAGPTPARITASVQKELLGKGDPAGREVLLAFVHNDLRQPVIVDAMYSVLEDIMGAPVVESERPQEAVLDGKRIVLNAEEEIVLQCGKASITLTKSGKVLIQGEYLSSHSRGANKIKGGSIQLN